MFPTAIEKTSALTRTAYKTALPIVVLLWLLPLFAVALTSLRSIDDLNKGNFWGWPTSINFAQNYGEVFTRSPMAMFLMNSVIITLFAVAGTLVLSCMAGYALAKYNFRGNLVLFSIFIAGNFVPFQILMIPVRTIMIDWIPLYDTVWALVLFHTAFQTGFCTLFMRNFIKQMPDALIEAARMDGAKGWNLLWHIILPQLRPATFIAVVVSVVGALRSFDLVSIMTLGGPYNSSTVLAYAMYEQTFLNFRYGYGAAIATILFIIMDVYIAFFLYSMLKREQR